MHQGQSPDTEIGRVYVYDLDDWDLPDKKFFWESLEHDQFRLDQDTGMIYMISGTADGKYHLKFRVFDRKHTQTDVPANVTVTVKTIPHEAVLNSGSVRISGITDEDFIRVWDYKVNESFINYINLHSVSSLSISDHVLHYQILILHDTIYSSVNLQYLSLFETLTG